MRLLFYNSTAKPPLNPNFDDVVSTFDHQDTLLIGGLAYFGETIYHCITPSHLILLTKTIVSRIASNDIEILFSYLLRDKSWIDDTFEFVGLVAMSIPRPFLNRTVTTSLGILEPVQDQVRPLPLSLKGITVLFGLVLSYGWFILCPRIKSMSLGQNILLGKTGSAKFHRIKSAVDSANLNTAPKKTLTLNNIILWGNN
ncbi:hypothetical protein BU17DRAFT_69422 [Hysterangium stoloniferum]|nr:hypothetical protein BU17DRAFT_69422 [Hysterangium stoloniferum]